LRIKIALRNLIISQVLIILFLVFAYFTWFPYSFSLLGGFTRTALMLIFVDLILGPLLVFIVFKEGKKYLQFDINVLLSIQIMAFIFGAYSLFLKHPAYAVFTGDRFTLTNVSEIYPYQPWQKNISTLFLSSPQLVVAKIPENKDEKSKLLLDVILNQKPDIDKRPHYYQPLRAHLETVLTSRLQPDTIFSTNNAQQKRKDFLQQHGGNINDYAFFPLRGNNKKDVIWAFSRKTFSPVGIIESDPWVQKPLARSLTLK
jgi:hypothetical protein